MAAWWNTNDESPSGDLYDKQVACSANLVAFRCSFCFFPCFVLLFSPSFHAVWLTLASFTHWENRMIIKWVAPSHANFVNGCLGSLNFLIFNASRDIRLCEGQFRKSIDTATTLGCCAHCSPATMQRWMLECCVRRTYAFHALFTFQLKQRSVGQLICAIIYWNNIVSMGIWDGHLANRDKLLCQQHRRGGGRRRRGSSFIWISIT